MKKFKLIEHTADVGIKVSAKTLKELFENCAYGMYNIICENFHNIEKKEKYQSTLKESDLESLLVSFLNDLLYQTSVTKIVFCDFKVLDLKNEKNFAEVSFSCLGEKYNREKHGKLFELKSATFHNLKIKKFLSFYKTTVIFDI
ncbi:MAG: archease [Elusimicrobiota bacterium]|nr:archease [Endomicrobiia bacterium]MDW8166493.1 archease [Elusimicrobiota bacterium]